MYVGGYRGAYNVTASAPTRDETARSEIEGLAQKTERQDLIIHTLIGILLEKGIFTEAEFKDFLVKIDELDGVRDGKLAKRKRGPTECRNCHGKNAADKTKCMYCGRPLEVEFEL